MWKIAWKMQYLKNALQFNASVDLVSSIKLTPTTYIDLVMADGVFSG